MIKKIKNKIKYKSPKGIYIKMAKFNIFIENKNGRKDYGYGGWCVLALPHR